MIEKQWEIFDQFTKQMNNPFRDCTILMLIILFRYESGEQRSTWGKINNDWKSQKRTRWGKKSERWAEKVVRRRKRDKFGAQKLVQKGKGGQLGAQKAALGWAGGQVETAKLEYVTETLWKYGSWLREEE